MDFDSDKTLLSVEEYELLTNWGMKYENYLRKSEYSKYILLFKSGSLFKYIKDKEKAINKIYTQVVSQIANREGIDETLKKEQYNLWFNDMNEIYKRVDCMLNSLLK